MHARMHARAFAILSKIVSNPSRAPSTSDGAQFIPKAEGSKWEVEITDNGARTMRLTECPAGFALVRKQNNPQTDACIECPGTSDHGYSLVPATWNGNADETNLEDFCLKCPTPPSSVKCWGGTNGNHSVSGPFSLCPSVPLPLSSFSISPCVDDICANTHDLETSVLYPDAGACKLMSTYEHSNRTRELVGRGRGGCTRGSGGS